MANILVADDDRDIRQLMTLVVELAGHVVTDVGDGSAALSQILAGGFDGVVLDNDMPGLSGLEVLVACRGLVAPDRPAFVMVSALASPRYVKLALEAGADEFVGKPFKHAHLIGTLERVLADRARDDLGGRRPAASA